MEVLTVATMKTSIFLAVRLCSQVAMSPSFAINIKASLFSEKKQYVSARQIEVIKIIFTYLYTHIFVFIYLFTHLFVVCSITFLVAHVEHSPKIG